MKEIIKKYIINSVWHFTEESNIALIKKHKGIFSLEEIERQQIHPVFGGNKWSHDADKQKNLHKFVHLTFIKEHPMLYTVKSKQRIKNPKWLKIKSSILLQEGIQFCSEVANKSDAILFTSEEAEKRIDFDVIFKYKGMDWNDPEIKKRRRLAVKSEILVPDCIPLNMIISIENG